MFFGGFGDKESDDICYYLYTFYAVSFEFVAPQLACSMSLCCFVLWYTCCFCRIDCVCYTFFPFLLRCCCFYI